MLHKNVLLMGDRIPEGTLTEFITSAKQTVDNAWEIDDELMDKAFDCLELAIRVLLHISHNCSDYGRARAYDALQAMEGIAKDEGYISSRDLADLHDQRLRAGVL